MTAYYNEFDPKAAAWLRELIKQGHIAHGEVDERSIEDVTLGDLAGFTQCHFFAGIGGWSLALRRAGWPDNRRVWTMSCPCQPFSAAGKGAGFDDERHLWPSGQYLISQCRPTVVFGEQVASKDADAWIDLVHTDMEALGYAFGAIPFPSAGVGAPHIRDRLYWVADAVSAGSQGHGGLGEIAVQIGRERAQGHCTEGSTTSGLADTTGTGRQERLGRTGAEGGESAREQFERLCAISRMADAAMRGRESEPDERPAELCGALLQQRGERIEPCDMGAASGVSPSSGPTNGFWRDADWLGCRDRKWRPVEPSTFPLADGVPARVGRLRGYGNAINIEAAKAFIESYM